MKRDKRGSSRRAARPADPESIAARDRSLLRRAAELLPLITVAATALVIIPGTRDPFRFPKEVIVRGAAILLIAIWSLMALRKEKWVVQFDARVVRMIAAATAWTAITAIFASNLRLSAAAFGWWCTTAVLAAGTFIALQSRKRLTDLLFLIVPASVSAILAMMQATRIWNPFTYDELIPDSMRTTALIGNPNDLGVFLVIALIAAVAVAIAAPRHRWIFVVATVILLGGVVAARTATATAGCAAALIAFIIAGSRRKGIAAGVLAAVVLATSVAVVFAAGFDRDDFDRLRRLDVLNETLSSRVTPFIAAFRMFKDNPLLGVGPGCWGYHYFDYKIAVERDHPELYLSGQAWSNFSEVHNDHLEVLAETGLPGYLILLAIAWRIASITFKPVEADAPAETRAARLIAFPVVAAFLVMALAQFPLQLASTTVALLLLSTAALAWSRA